MCSVYYHTGENFNFLTALASVSAFATAIATLFTVKYARKTTEIAKDALEESQKARKSASFSTLFAQLFDNHISIFSNETLKTTREKDKSVFTSFFEHCKGKNTTSVIIDSTFIKDTLYNDFLKKNGVSSDFSRCFKFVYHEIKTVQNTFTEKEKDERKHYIGIIQASMNYDELFAYFINLLQHFANMLGDKDENDISKVLEVEDKISRKIKGNEDISKLLQEKKEIILKLLKEEDINFLELLKEDEFFKNLTEGHSPEYKEIIEKICNTPDPRINFLAGRIIKKEWLE